MPDFGDGWDLSTLEILAPTSCSNDGGFWAWSEDPITSEASGQINGIGCYYESPLGGTDPDDLGDNYGDRCPEGLQLEFCFEIKTVSYENCETDMNLDVHINTLSDDESGSELREQCIWKC